MSRIPRSARSRQKPATGARGRAGWFGIMVLALLALVVAVVAVGRLGSPTTGSQSGIAAAEPTTQSASDLSASVEVPSLLGEPRAEAVVVLEAAGFSVRSVGPGDGDAVVVQQNPVGGTLLPHAASVSLVVEQSSESSEDVGDRGWVVVIDPGHQRRSDMTPEPIGPGARQSKPRVTGGTSGVVTELPEYEVVLQISTNLQARLEASGVEVVMARTTNDVNLSNQQRAGIANKHDADLFVRVHCDGNPDQELAGISTLYPGRTRWSAEIARTSKAAAHAIQRAVVSSTGATDRGIVPRTDLAGFNYAKVPAVLVECGFMSHPVEDKLLSSPRYQDQLASGIAVGIIEYLETAK